MVVQQLVVILVCSWEEVSSRSFYSTILSRFSGIFSDHNSMKLEVNYRKKGGSSTNSWGLSNMQLKN